MELGARPEKAKWDGSALEDHTLWQMEWGRGLKGFWCWKRAPCRAGDLELPSSGGPLPWVLKTSQPRV